MSGFLRRWWPLLAWATLIAVSSSAFVSTKQFVRWMSDYTPWSVTEAQFGVFWERWWWVFVKGFHVLEFSVLFLLVVATLRRTRMSHRAVLFASFGLCAGYAALDEWHQTFVRWRGGRVTDFLIDMGGVTVLLVALAARHRSAARVQNRG